MYLCKNVLSNFASVELSADVCWSSLLLKFYMYRLLYKEKIQQSCCGRYGSFRLCTKRGDISFSLEHSIHVATFPLILDKTKALDAMS